MRLKAFKFGLFLLALLPGACHYNLTSPALWAHNSSAAFDVWVLLWAGVIAMPIMVLFLPTDSRRGCDSE
jgi:heme/copper-type cytochrome/quinol oxidase subunit 2